MGDATSPKKPRDASASVPTISAELMSREELIRLYRAEREARIAAVQQLDTAFRETDTEHQSKVVRDYVMASAHCLLWYADIYETDDRYLGWHMEFPNIDAARRFLPLEIEPEQTLSDAWYRRRYPADRDECDRIGTAAVRAGQSYQQEFRCVCEDGSLRWLHEDVHVETVVEGRQWRAVGVCTDISAHYQLRAQMQAANTRLTRSIAETHHRVKDNLQAVASLADMHQNVDGSSPETRAALLRMSQHIRALAEIHDLLMHEARGGSDVDIISLRSVLEKLIHLVRETVADRSLTTNIAPVVLPSRQVAAVVILVNELVSNAIKHSRSETHIEVELRNGIVHIDISDDGPGFPADFDPLSSSGTGLEIVEAIGRWDLQGKLVYETRPEGGARVRLEFLAGAATPS